MILIQLQFNFQYIYMGILKLMDFIKTKYPKCMQRKLAQNYKNKIIAIDASNTMYQFLIKTQTITKNAISTPTDWLGNKTGHLIGLLSRNLFCIQNNILPIWVFDGRPPAQKYKQLSRRKKFKQQATQKLQIAKQHGDLIEALRQTQRTVSISQTQKQDAKTMLRLMGMPVIQAPGQAEAQCAFFAKQGLAFGVVTQDMDTLTHGSPLLIKNFNKKQTINEINLRHLLDQMKFTMQQFIDFCILCGCDYTTKISNIGPVRAYSMLLQLGSIESILQNIVQSNKGLRYKVDEQFNHILARKLFTNPLIQKQNFKIQWNPVDEQKLRQFLLEKQFSINRINNWIINAQKK